MQGPKVFLQVCLWTVFIQGDILWHFRFVGAIIIVKRVYYCCWWGSMFRRGTRGACPVPWKRRNRIRDRSLPGPGCLSSPHPLEIFQNQIFRYSVKLKILKNINKKSRCIKTNPTDFNQNTGTFFNTVQRPYYGKGYKVNIG